MGVFAGVRLRARRGRIDIGAGVARSERLIAQGRPEEGESALRELLTACETTLRPDDRRWVSVRLALGTAQLALNRPQEAVPIVTTALAEAERHRGTQSAVIPPLRSLVVLVLVLAGRHAEAADAAKRMEQAYGGGRDLEVILPRYHLRGRWLQNLVLYCTGRFREGLDAGSALLPDMIAVLGADHTDVSQHRLLRSAHLAALGQAGEALAECETVIATEGRPQPAGPTPGTDTTPTSSWPAACWRSAGRRRRKKPYGECWAKPRTSKAPTATTPGCCGGHWPPR
jgi:uncharacterized protein (DUF2237 family)